MDFFININPPTATAQEKQVRVVHGKPIFYNPTPVKEARQLLIGHLNRHKPDEPLQGAIALTTVWLFPKGKSHKHGEWRITKPDTDNLQKLLKDCMTKCGFWKDDAQVVKENVEKRWSDEPTGIYIEIQQLGTKSETFENRKTSVKLKNSETLENTESLEEKQYARQLVPQQ